VSLRPGAATSLKRLIGRVALRETDSCEREAAPDKSSGWTAIALGGVHLVVVPIRTRETWSQIWADGCRLAGAVRNGAARVARPGDPHHRRTSHCRRQGPKEISLEKAGGVKAQPSHPATRGCQAS